MTRTRAPGVGSAKKAISNTVKKSPARKTKKTSETKTISQKSSEKRTAMRRLSPKKTSAKRTDRKAQKEATYTIVTAKEDKKRIVPSRAAIQKVYQQLLSAHPDAHCELVHDSPFQLICATALSAQSTDIQVNKVTPGLFKKFPTPELLALAEQEEVEACVNSLGMFRQKSKNLIGMAKALVKNHQGVVPAIQDALVALPGVGRKTANVVLGVAFKSPVGVVVDTHVQRITQRLGWTLHSTPDKIEFDLMKLIPQSEWDRVSHTLIFHGRRICSARKPACSTCPVNKKCVSAFNAEEVGRKPKKLPRKK